MEAGTLHLHIHSIYCTPIRPFRYHRSSSRSFPRFSISSSLQSEGFRGPKPSRNLVADWVSNNDNVARSLPIYVGGFSLLAVLFNRTVSGIAPVADASSSQSRADLLALGLAVTNILTGLVWLSIRPKAISKVDPEGVECRWISPNLPDSAISELEWFWQSLSAVTCCRSLVIIYEESCICQIGVAAESLISGEAENVDAKKLIQGTLYRGIMKSGAQSYLANLSLYPGKSELPFLPSNTQAVILQPLGDKGIAIIGGDTIRGFSTADQAWISLIGDKLDATLTKSVTGDALMTPDTGR
ncbi:protein COFACTOR ASSEMBLY OF COMPLEX C SUBUNIT B CCB4, chloroplastic-like isoform X1 [Chenopodium quinoa]|uniref:protein COFACTOR ASSEMBLY OF COMPLEX C SUBUNIT B CCB4, chloroplastic-like isoform X1 n=1 Tax=Chenopodium quinoa TaxID=63459 RepID=UPI000B783B0A|nr:protein COFACTOR ASSEMBLY OF COMPLEX C SUBUNIT B CCB4, chloroplastic-like isoform X1 [Chenopodium quinoa]